MNEQIRGEIIEAGENDEGVPVIVVKVTWQQLASLARNPLFRPSVVTIEHQEDK